MRGLLTSRAGSELVEVEPSTLSATQDWLLRPPFEFYLEDTYRRTGLTYADRFNLGNRYPTVYVRTGPDGLVTNMLLTGHHRSAAAWCQGRPVLCRIVRGPWGADR